MLDIFCSLCSGSGDEALSLYKCQKAEKIKTTFLGLAKTDFIKLVSTKSIVQEMVYNSRYQYLKYLNDTQPYR